MFEKNMKIAYLLDFYIDLLDEHSASIIRAYYEDDLSLAEIASGENISRQGIRHIIKKGEEQLEFFESKLGLARKHEELDGVVSSLERLKEKLLSSTDEKLVKEADALSSVISTISNKGV